MTFPRRAHHSRQWKALLRDILWELEEAGESEYAGMLNALHPEHTTTEPLEDIDRYLSAFAYLEKKGKARVVEEHVNSHPPAYKSLGLTRFSELQAATTFDADTGQWRLDWPVRVCVHIGK